MAVYRLTELAQRDLEEIWDFIAADSPDNADRVLDKIHKRFRLLGRNPYIGRSRDDLRPAGMRSLPVYEYLILYRVVEPGVRIIRVVHGRRKLDELNYERLE